MANLLPTLVREPEKGVIMSLLDCVCTSAITLTAFGRTALDTSQTEFVVAREFNRLARSCDSPKGPHSAGPPRLQIGIQSRAIP